MIYPLFGSEKKRVSFNKKRAKALFIKTLLKIKSISTPPLMQFFVKLIEKIFQVALPLCCPKKNSHPFFHHPC